RLWNRGGIARRRQDLAAEGLREEHRGCESVGRNRCHRSRHRALYMLRNASANFAERLRHFRESLCKDCLCSWPSEGPLPRKHLVQDTGEAVLIALAV